MIKRMIEVDVKLTPRELAELFCSMNETEQAGFFNVIAEDNMHKNWLPFQLKAVTDCKLLTSEARYVMNLIGEYSNSNVLK